MKEGTKSRKISEASHGMRIAHERLAATTNEWIVLKMIHGGVKRSIGNWKRRGAG
jgi:hypothetical protein